MARTKSLKRTFASVALSMALAMGLLPIASSAWADDALGGSAVSDPSFESDAPLLGDAVVPYAEMLADEPSSAIAESGEGEDYAEGEVLVVLASGEVPEKVEEGLAETGVSPVESLEESHVEGKDVVAVAIDDGKSVAQKIDELMESEEVVFAQPNYLYAFEGGMPSDPVFQDDRANWWHLDDINVFSAWNIAKVGHGVRVATVDSGVRIDHEDLAGNLDLDDAYNTVTGQTGAQAAVDRYGHGTHVAGLIAAEADNGIGVAGSSFNAEVVPVNVVHTSGQYAGQSTTADFIEAMDYIMSLGDVRIVNISMGTYGYDQLLGAIMAVAETRDIVVVGAGGNKGNTAQGAQPSYPADFSSVVSVTWYDSAGVRDYRSDYGSGKNIAAPGTSIYSTLYSSANAYGMKSGSSMAAPIVSGVCALMLSANPNLSASQVRDVLYGTATDAGAAGWDAYYGWGKVDAFAAVTGSLSTNPAPVSALTSVELSGADRVETSVAIAKEEFPGGPKGVIIVRSDNFPDALAASSLAGTLGYPILMSSSDALSPAVAAYIKSAPTIRQAVLIGDRNSLSSRVQSSVGALVSSCVRIGGSDRFETAALLRESLDRVGAGSSTAIVARSDNYPDALSISPYCAASHAGLFLIAPGAAPSKAMIAELTSYDRVVIVGSTDSVSSKVESSLRGYSVETVRLAGGVGNAYSDDRYGTSAAIAQWIVSSASGDYAFSYDYAAIATGSKFPDALAGGPMCAVKRSVLLLVDANAYAAVDAAASSGQVSHLYWLGSTDTLSPSVRQAVLSKLV